MSGTFKGVMFAAVFALVSSVAQAKAKDVACQGEILKSYPNGTWLENLAQDHGGRLYFSVMSDRRIDLYEPGRGVRTFADLPIYPMGIAILRDRLVVAGNRRPMSDGAATLTANAIAEVSFSGRVTRLTDVKDGLMLNGVVRLARGGVLVADSKAGVIWRYDPLTGAVSTWLKDDLLSPPPGAPPSAVGVNGLKVFGDQLLISNTARGAILRVGLSPKGSAVGAVSTFRTTGVVDDFDVAADSTIFAAPYKDNIVRVGPSGMIDFALPSGAEGSTAVGLIGDRARPSAFYVLTTGNLLFGGKDPAKLLRVPVPALGACGSPSR